MRHVSLFLTICAVVLTSCSTSSAGSDANAVHQQWVTALRQGDRAAALAATAPQQAQDAFVDDHLNRMHDIITQQGNGRVVYGALQTVDMLPVTGDGTHRTGLSVWHFAQQLVCYETVLVASDGQWGVTQWGQRATCPGGPS